MLPKLLPGALRLRADPSQSFSQLVKALPEDFDAFLFHLNCTRTDHFPSFRPQLIDFLRDQGVACLNAHITDISKRTLQNACVLLRIPTTRTGLTGSGKELLIVKTNNNYGGNGDLRLRMRVDSTRPSGHFHSPIRNAMDYRVMQRRNIPVTWWENKSLTIERFISNRYMRQYRVYFAGTHLHISEWRDPRPIKKYRKDIVKATYSMTIDDLFNGLAPVLPTSLAGSIAAIIKHFRIDFGAVDIVEDDDGLCYAIDINSTSFGRALDMHARAYLRRGLLVRIQEEAK
jgi:hypothetical protein